MFQINHGSKIECHVSGDILTTKHILSNMLDEILAHDSKEKLLAKAINDSNSYNSDKDQSMFGNITLHHKIIGVVGSC